MMCDVDHHIEPKPARRQHRRCRGRRQRHFGRAQVALRQAEADPGGQRAGPRRRTPRHQGAL